MCSSQSACLHEIEIPRRCEIAGRPPTHHIYILCSRRTQMNVSNCIFLLARQHCLNKNWRTSGQMGPKALVLIYSLSSILDRALRDYSWIPASSFKSSAPHVGGLESFSTGVKQYIIWIHSPPEPYAVHSIGQFNRKARKGEEAHGVAKLRRPAQSPCPYTPHDFSPASPPHYSEFY